MVCKVSQVSRDLVVSGVIEVDGLSCVFKHDNLPMDEKVDRKEIEQYTMLNV